MTRSERHTWTEVRDRIRARIQDRVYAPGDKLPRDADIAAELGCARATVQRAMRDLADAGLVERRRKGGTQVRADPVTRATLDIPVTRREVEAQGRAYSYQLIRRALEDTPMRVAARFGLPGPARMLHVEALHLADARPFVCEDRWIRPETVPEILDIDLAAISANEWLVRNRPYSRCDLRFYAIGADGQTAQRLDTAPGSALFVIDRTTWAGPAPITTVRAISAPGYELVTRI